MAKYHVDDELLYDGELDLVKAVIKNMANGNGRGLDFFMHSDAPPGSGLGSSSTVVVALIGLIQRWKHLPLTSYDIAELAYISSKLLFILAPAVLIESPVPSAPPNVPRSIVCCAII